MLGGIPVKGDLLEHGGDEAEAAPKRWVVNGHAVCWGLNGMPVCYLCGAGKPGSSLTLKEECLVL